MVSEDVGAKIVVRAAEMEDRPSANAVRWSAGWEDAPTRHRQWPEADADWQARHYFQEIVAEVEWGEVAARFDCRVRFVRSGLIASGRLCDDSIYLPYWPQRQQQMLSVLRHEVAEAIMVSDSQEPFSVPVTTDLYLSRHQIARKLERL